MISINITLPKKIVDYVDREAEDKYLSRASVARQYLMEKLEEKIVSETRLKGYSIRKTSEITGIPYLKTLKILAKTQVDEK
jgi:metal-responsive CopG/Arc/MetJ family transcriptional regulator